MATQLQDISLNRSMDSPRILIADDQPDILEALRLLLKAEGYQTEIRTFPAAVLEAVRTQHFDALLIDLNYSRDTTSGQEGLDLLSQIRAIDKTLPVVVMTAWSTVALAVEAMHRGVGDFVQKPWENARLLDVLRAQIGRGQALRKEQRLEAARSKEFQEAREIQLRLLPKEIPQIQARAISAAWQPARGVSGDYFDVLKFSEDTAALCIADVSGKGLPAALLMSNLQAAVRAVASETLQPEDVCARVNLVVGANIAANKFISFFYCLLDTRDRRLSYANAGHNPPILLRRDGSHLRLDQGGAVLGVFQDWSCEPGEIELATGDRLILFTDGVTEVRNSEDAEFGEERLIRLLEQNSALGAPELQVAIMRAITEFGGGDFQDDATLIVMSVE